MFKKFLLVITLLTLLMPSSVLAQGGQPPAPGGIGTDPMVLAAQSYVGNNNVVIGNALPSSVVKTVQGSQSAQPLAPQSSPLFPGAPNATTVIADNHSIPLVQVTNKTDLAINTASMIKVGVVKYDVSSQLPTAGINEVSTSALLNQNAKTYVASNTNIADTKTVVTQKVGEMTYNAYQTADGKTVLVPDAYTAKLIQDTGINPLGAKADYTFLNGEAAKAATGGALKDYGFKPEQVQKATGGDMNANIDYLARVYANSNADAVKANAIVESQNQWQALAQGKGPLVAFVKAYNQTLSDEMARADPNYSYALNLLYATQAAAGAGISARDNYVDNEYIKAASDMSTGKQYAALNTVTGVGANGTYLSTDVDPNFWADLSLQTEKGALAQGNDLKQVSMVFVYDKCPPGVPCKPMVPTKPGTTGTNPFAPTAGGGAGDLEPILTAAGYGVNPLGICAARDWSIGQDNPSAPPYMNSGKTGPNNPVVINQDPTKRGVDISVNVTVPPVIVGYNGTYTERINERPDPSNPSKTIWDRLIEECRRYAITIPDRVANMNVVLDLSAESVNWITNDLALRYPGLRVYQGHWDVFPGLCAGGTFNDFREFGCFAKSIPLKDPGYYILTINGMTTGTVVTAPRPISYLDRVGVSALMVALIK